MNGIDLNFLTEGEVETIVNVIEKDFELKAAEKARLSRLRKTLIRNDQRAVQTNEANVDGPQCTICFRKFIFLFNPRRICCSCGLQICRYCSRFVKMFENYICLICQKQKDLISMNCSWFYENIKRKFTDGGSQVVANSLSEYPRKNLITPEILCMVKGTQISKFRLQMDEVTRTIEESLVKVELSSTDSETKSNKCKELIQMFVEKVKHILRNTRQVLYLTMDNYLSKLGKKNTNIDIEVLNTLHEEVELRIGKKIDIRMCQRKLLKGNKTLDDLDNEDSLETRLSTPILDKVLYDVQQSLMENRGKAYEDLNQTLKSMVKKTKYDFMDFDFESVSQVIYRQGSIRQTVIAPSPQPSLISKKLSVVSQQSSRLYDLSGAQDKSSLVSKQWNQLLSNKSYDETQPEAVAQDTSRSSSFSLAVEDSMPIDSDALSMPTINQSKESNWLMKTRYPLESLNSFLFDTKPSFVICKNDVKKEKNIEQRNIENNTKLTKENRFSSAFSSVRSNSDSLDKIFHQNKSILSNRDNLSSLDDIYKTNQYVLPNGNNADLLTEYLLNCETLGIKPENDITKFKESKRRWSRNSSLSRQISNDQPKAVRNLSVRQSISTTKGNSQKIEMPNQPISLQKINYNKTDNDKTLTRDLSMAPVSKSKSELSREPSLLRQSNVERLNDPPKQIHIRPSGSQARESIKALPKVELSRQSSLSKQNIYEVSKEPSKVICNLEIEPISTPKLVHPEIELSRQESLSNKSINQVSKEPYKVIEPVSAPKGELRRESSLIKETNVELSKEFPKQIVTHKSGRPTTESNKSVPKTELSREPSLVKQTDVQRSNKVPKPNHIRISVRPTPQPKETGPKVIDKIGTSNPLPLSQKNNSPKRMTITHPTSPSNELLRKDNTSEPIKPTVPLRKSQIIQSSSTLPHLRAPEVPKRKSQLMSDHKSIQFKKS